MHTDIDRSQSIHCHSQYSNKVPEKSRDMINKTTVGLEYLIFIVYSSHTTYKLLWWFDSNLQKQTTPHLFTLCQRSSQCFSSSAICCHGTAALHSSASSCLPHLGPRAGTQGPQSPQHCSQGGNRAEVLSHLYLHSSIPTHSRIKAGLESMTWRE